jgi:hypothetical protein
MLIVYILNVNPLYLEVAFKFKGMVFPPKRESFLVVARFEPGYTFEHSTFDCAEE